MDVAQGSWRTADGHSRLCHYKATILNPRFTTLAPQVLLNT